MTLYEKRQVVLIYSDVEQPDMYLGTFEIPQDMILKDQVKLYDAYVESRRKALRAWEDIREGRPWVPCPLPWMEFVQWLQLQHGNVKKVDVEVFDVGN